MTTILKESPTPELNRRALPLYRTHYTGAALAGLVLIATACSGSSAGTGAAHAGTTRTGGQLSTRGGQTSGYRGTSAGVTVTFARCMRSHGVPKFPDPNGQTGLLGPGSGVDPSSLQFQSALNGPCKSLAPLAWVSSGKLSKRSGP